MKRRIGLGIGVIVFLIISGVFLYKSSFDPQFTVVDALSGATKKKEHVKQTTEWGYTADDFSLGEKKQQYQEKKIFLNGKQYQVLWKITAQKQGKLILIVNKENRAYKKAASEFAGQLEQEGYQIQIREDTELMFQSVARSGKFDILLLNGEEQQ